MNTETRTPEGSGESDCYRAVGYERCQWEPGPCDRCKNTRQLYFGDVDYWDGREGVFLCEPCVREKLTNHLKCCGCGDLVGDLTAAQYRKLGWRLFRVGVEHRLICPDCRAQVDD